MWAEEGLLFVEVAELVVDELDQVVDVLERVFDHGVLTWRPNI